VSVAIVIPARYASTRLPGKSLLSETGKPLIQHVYERARAVKNVAQVIVATDDERIAAAVRGFGGEAAMTGAHETGGARVAEVAARLDAEIIVNLQGDEPEVEPAYLERLIALQKSTKAFVTTLACPFPAGAHKGPGSPADPSAVKAVLGDAIDRHARWAQYFTRRAKGWPRDASGGIPNPQDYFLHIGVYAFTKSSLARFASAPRGALEKIENLEQLRILEMGEKIAVGLVGAAAPGIDTPEDYQAFVQRHKTEGAARQ